VVKGSILLDYKATPVGNWFQIVHSNVAALSSRVHIPEKNSFQTFMQTSGTSVPDVSKECSDATLHHRTVFNYRPHY
jgi:hypothetical protein